MENPIVGVPVETDVRFQGYRLEVVSQWPPSPRKNAAVAAISQRLTSLARCALVRPDIADLLHLSCRLLDDFFAAGDVESCVEVPLSAQEVHEALDVY